MKMSSFPTLFAGSLLVAASVFANDRVGNGGFAHVCRDSTGKVISAALLDLWEAESLKPLRSERPVDLQVEEALAKLRAFSPNAYDSVAYRYDQLKGAVVMTSRPLSQTEDAFPPYEPAAGCKYEQVARFEPVLTETGTSGLRIFSEIYDSPVFSNSDRAALFVHEAVYLVDRLASGAKNSQRARTLTGHLISESTVPNAVRLLFMYAIGMDQLHDDGEPAPAMLALPDPLKIGAIVRFYEVDGMSFDALKPSRKKRQYRCVVGPSFPQEGESIGDSGYRPIPELISYRAPIDLRSTFMASEHAHSTADDGRQTGYTTGSSIQIQCYKKVSQSKEIKVPFVAALNFEGAECMNVSSNGSTFVGVGAACEIQVTGTREFNRKYPGLRVHSPINVVRALAK